MISFKNQRTEIKFDIVKEAEKERVYIKELLFDGKSFALYKKGIPHTHLYFLGTPYKGKMFNRYANFGEDLFFTAKKQNLFNDKKQLVIEERNDRVLVKTFYTLYENSAVLSVKKEVTNTCDEQLTIECFSSLTLKGIMGDDDEREIVVDKKINDETTEIGVKNNNLTEYHETPIFWKAHNTWCCEAVFEKFDLLNEGMRCKERVKRCGKISVVGNGSQTTNRYLPLGLFEKENYGYFLFEILPVGSWSYEIEAGSADYDDHEITLQLSGKTLSENGWFKTLKQNETYTTEEVRVIGGQDLDTIVSGLTDFRRNVKRHTESNVAGKVIYNVFQNNCWATPSEEQDKKWIPIVAESGSDYYVIDAGWFDDGDTHAIGIWDECSERYPSGLKKTADAIKANGMKIGLWVELQSVGVKCADKNLLPEYCFFHINGVRPVCNGRYQLNYSYKEVRDYADGIIKKIVERYDVGYIKIDYNQTQLGNECENGSYVEGLAEHVRNYLKWFEDIQNKYPNVIFETCASGGLCMDSNVASKTTVFSASDQGIYYNYPQILANLPFAILPEQMGIWCVPVRISEYPHTTDEQVIFNVINILYGVIHLCSKIDVLTHNQKALLREGLAYYRSLAKVKIRAYPVFPKGFARCDDEIIFTGFKTDDRLYLSVYNMSGSDMVIEQDLSRYGVSDVKLTYPKKADNVYTLQNGKFKCEMKTITARAFEFRLNNSGAKI